METADESFVDVIVVGAGLAGLTCATELERAGRSVRVIEAADRVGGRVRSRRLPVTGVVVEQGAGWIGETQTAVWQLAAQLGLTLRSVKRAGRDAGTAAAELGPLAIADYVQAVARFERLVSRTPLARPWAAAGAGRRDAVSFEHWISKNVATAQVRELLAGITTLSCGCPPRDVSLLGMLVHCRTAGGLRRLIGQTDDGALGYAIEGGNAQLAERMAASLAVRVQLGVRAVRVGQDHEGVTVEYEDGSARARACVLACDPRMTAAIAFEPALPATSRELGVRWAMNSGAKAHLVYDRPFWRDAGWSGTAGTRSPLAPYVWDASGEDGYGVLGCFSAAEREPGEFARTVPPLLAELFGPRALDVLEADVHDWGAHGSVGGCVSAPPPGLLTAAGDALTPSHGRVHFAGAELSELWDGHMDGAVRTGRAAAAQLVGP